MNSQTLVFLANGIVYAGLGMIWGWFFFFIVGLGTGIVATLVLIALSLGGTGYLAYQMDVQKTFTGPHIWHMSRLTFLGGFLLLVYS
ncbi:hypothetical protein [Salsuginibacillus kocurii]|uniref:hypothetical protein n=1 Tax=Salsuginibacillus kocurii TaxID=427078 RepID=UPI00035EDCDF|nr:hypothetical protein [Salsuginibacillus kocurii]